MVNGVALESKTFGEICAYIMQDDILLDFLTVRESLLFGARLKLKASLEECEKRVEKLIDQVIFVINLVRFK